MRNSVGLETTHLLPTQCLLGFLGSWPHSCGSASCAALVRSSMRGERQLAFFQAMRSPQLCKQPRLGLTAVCSPPDSPRARQMAEILPPCRTDLWESHGRAACGSGDRSLQNLHFLHGTIWYKNRSTSPRT